MSSDWLDIYMVSTNAVGCEAFRLYLVANTACSMIMLGQPDRPFYYLPLAAVDVRFKS